MLQPQAEAFQLLSMSVVPAPTDIWSMYMLNIYVKHNVIHSMCLFNIYHIICSMLYNIA